MLYFSKLLALKHLIFVGKEQK